MEANWCLGHGPRSNCPDDGLGCRLATVTPPKLPVVGDPSQPIGRGMKPSDAEPLAPPERDDDHGLLRWHDGEQHPR